MITKVKYMVLFAWAVVSRQSELEKAELRAKISLAQFEGIQKSIDRTINSVLTYRTKVDAKRQKNARIMASLKAENSRLKNVESSLGAKASQLNEKKSQIEKIAV